MSKILYKKNLFNKSLNLIEKAGNKLPHPAVLFSILAASIILISYIGNIFQWQVTYTAINGFTMEKSEITVGVVSLLDGDGIRYIFTNAVSNFMGFTPLGTILVISLGIGIADGSGLISTVLKNLVLITPKSVITVILVFAGILSNIASDTGYVLLIPLGAIVFLNFNRHPLAGMAATFAGVSGGFSANLLIGTLDPLLGGISTEAARILDYSYEVSVFANWYFMVVSTFLIAFLGWFVTEKVVEPRLGAYVLPKNMKVESITEITKDQKKGLLYAFVSCALYFTLIALLTLPAKGILRNQLTFSILHNSPFVKSIVLIIALFFFIVGLAYGIGAKTIKNDRDIVDYINQSLSRIGGYLVLVFIASQFIDYFSYTNLGTILAVSGSNLLEFVGLKGLPLVIGFIILSAILNLFVGSATVKWAILAPVFVPMFMKMGISPEVTQLAYRIGDSTTNIISPLMAHFTVIITFARKYDNKVGMGNIIALMMPYSVVFLIGWTVLLVVWYIIGIPVGPGVFIHYINY